MAERMMQDIEQKEQVDRAQFMELMRRFQQGLERNQDFEISVNGENYTIPATAFDSGRFRVEYEIDDGEYEFEMTLKWR